jgi:hypothetical protein
LEKVLHDSPPSNHHVSEPLLDFVIDSLILSLRETTSPVPLQTKASTSEWLEIHKILTIFCNSTELLINAQKSSFYQFGAQQAILDTLKATFLYNINDLTDGFKYLGYFLKVGRYKVEEWDWILGKYENRISHWCNRWLTIGGRLVLIKALLESQPIYWSALANIPSLVLDKIHQVVFNFL